MKTAISLPDPVFEEAERLAQELGLSRSELYSNALQDYLNKYNRTHRLNTLNQVYEQESSDVDPWVNQMQMMSLSHEDW